MVFLEIPPTSSSQLLLAPALLRDSSAPRKAVNAGDRPLGKGDGDVAFPEDSSDWKQGKNHTKKELLNLHFIAKISEKLESSFRT